MIYPHAKAKALAIEIGNLLLPHCEVLNIAGSIRRCKPEVKDIELICIPKLVKVGNVDLFGNDNRKEIIDTEYIKSLELIGKVIKGKPDGRYMQIETKSGIMLDLFTPQRNDYYRIYAIRTGSAVYAHKVIAAAWLKIGWCGTTGGLRLQTECTPKIFEGKTTWTCTTPNPTLPPAWESEKDFFQWINVQFIHPQYRDYV